MMVPSSPSKDWVIDILYCMTFMAVAVFPVVQHVSDKYETLAIQLVLTAVMIGGLALLAEIVGYGATVWSYKPYKVLISMLAAIWLVYSASKAFGDVNFTLGIDGSHCPFTVSIFTYLNAITIPFGLFGKVVVDTATFGIVVAGLSCWLFYPSIMKNVALEIDEFRRTSFAGPPLVKKHHVVFLRALRRCIPNSLFRWLDVTSAKYKDYPRYGFRRALRMLGRFTAIFLLTIAGMNVELGDRLRAQYPIKSQLVTLLALKLDFSNSNHCENSRAIHHPVIFMEQGRVLVATVKSSFSATYEVVECYTSLSLSR